MRISRKPVPVAVERRSGRDRAKDPSDRTRRRCDRSAGGDDYTREEVEFLRAIDAYKRSTGNPFPTWSQVLAIAKKLGYRKVGNDERQ